MRGCHRDDESALKSYEYASRRTLLLRRLPNTALHTSLIAQYRELSVYIREILIGPFVTVPAK
jgi:hypothetical protein